MKKRGNEAASEVAEKTNDRSSNSRGSYKGMSEKEIQKAFPKVDEKKPMFLTFDTFLERKVGQISEKQDQTMS